MKKRKGAVTDLFLWLIISFVIIIVLGAFMFMGNTINNKLKEQIPQLQATMGTSTNVTEVIESSVGALPKSFESFKWIAIMLMVGMLLSLVMSGFLVKVHPAFFVVNILLILIAIVVAIPFSNAYEKLYLDPTLGATFQGFWGASYIWLHLPIWVIVAGFLSIIVMFISMSRGDSLGGMY